MNGPLNEDACTVHLGAVAVTDENVFVAEGVGCAVASGLIFLLVALDEVRAAAFQHRLAVTVNVGTVYVL